MMEKEAVYIMDPYHEDAVALLESAEGIEVVLWTDPRKVDWHRHADGVLVRSETPLQASDFNTAERLRAVVKQGVGVNNIDLAAAKDANVAVHNTPGPNSEPVAGLTLALALSPARRIVEVDHLLRKEEKVVRSQTMGPCLFRKTVGVVGMGNIGKIPAQKWIWTLRQALGASEAKIIGYDPFAPVNVWYQDQIPHTRASTLDRLLKESDVVLLHLPLLASTGGLIGLRELKLMKETAILVNTARGGIVDEKALLDALKEKTIWGAALHALEVEPPSLEAQRNFFELRNMIITPHIGASTVKNQINSGLTAVRTLLVVLQGKNDVPGKLV